MEEIKNERKRKKKYALVAFVYPDHDPYRFRSTAIHRQMDALSAAMNGERKKKGKIVESTVELMHGLFALHPRYRFDKLLINGMKSAGEFGLGSFNNYNDISF